MHKSQMQKKRPAVFKAIGLYPIRLSSISVSVTFAISYFFSISAVKTEAADRISIAEASPRMSLDSLSTVRIWFSVSYNLALNFALSSTSCSFFVSRSGFSLATTIPSSWSVRPSQVIMKFKIVTFVETSGRQCGFRSFVVKQNLKSRL